MRDNYEKIKKDYAESFTALEKLWEQKPVDKVFSDKFFEKDYVCPKWQSFKKSVMESFKEEDR